MKTLASLGAIAALSLSVPVSAEEEPAPVQIVSIDPVISEIVGRHVPIRITAPATGADLPIIVLSHGNLLNRNDYRPLVEHLARAGYIIVQPDHPDASDYGLRPEQWPADTWRTRADTIAAIGNHIDAILAATPNIAARADTKQLAVMGHSFGGHTTALAMGAKVEGEAQTPSAPWKAAVMLSAPGNWAGLTPRWKELGPYLKVDWSGFHGPALMINGTADTGPMSDEGAGWHDDGYNLAPSSTDVCLLRIEGAGHYLGGIDSFLRPPAGDATAERHELVFDAVTGFLDTSLGRETEAAKAWAAIRPTAECKQEG